MAESSAAAATLPASPAVTAAPDAARSKHRMVHIRLSPEPHRTLRLIVTARDTSLQDWIAQTIEDAVQQAWPSAGEGATS